MDFWAQHKDFILKVLAGAGVFLVALIARSITYGDELEQAKSRNAALQADIASKKVAPMPRILELEADAKRLKENAAEVAEQVGWNLADNRLDQTLLERILRTTRRYARESDANVARAAEDYRAAIKENLNGGFGQLRLMVKKELLEEANEKNIKVGEDIGFGNVLELESGDLRQYLLQLELVARLARYAIDAKIDSIGDIQITSGKPQDAIPGANPDFLQEYEVKFTFTGTPKSGWAIVNRLEQESPHPALSGLRITKETRPADRITVEMTLLVTASNPSSDEVRFAKEKS